MGWEEGSGLGPQKQGITAPVNKYVREFVWYAPSLFVKMIKPLFKICHVKIFEYYWVEKSNSSR